MSVIGGMISQLPAGILADRLSRHSVLLVYSIMDLWVIGIPLVYVMFFLFGLTTYPTYSICAAHASDFVESDRMVRSARH